MQDSQCNLKQPRKQGYRLYAVYKAEKIDIRTVQSNANNLRKKKDKTKLENDAGKKKDSS
jgi:hypothetical protein